MTTPPAELEAAYRATLFRVKIPTGACILRVDAQSADLDELLRGHGATTWAFITAYNPGSCRLTQEENDARMTALEQAVAGSRHPVYWGEGVDPTGRWPSEPSLLVVGIELQEALELAARFGQLAILTGEAGQPVRLAWATSASG